MIRRLVFTLLIVVLANCTESEKVASAFSFHLFMEPQHLDPARSRASSASYFFYNTLRGLYKINAHNQPEPEGGLCLWYSDTLLTCTLKADQWSNGDPVTADDYVRVFRHVIDPETASPRSHLLKNIKNAKQILTGDLAVEALGVRSQGPLKLLIEFSRRDREFFYKLASTALYPTHKDHDPNKKAFNEFVVNGPYKVKDWQPGKLLQLEPNPNYTRGHSKRPALDIHFIDDELTAYRLYEKGKLTFLRRVPSQLISLLKEREDFYQQPMLRFDYIGFGESIMSQPHLREAMVQAVNYQKLKILLGALERPGCPSIPKSWLVNQQCYNFDLKKARVALEKVEKKYREQTYQLKVSQLGGNDIKKQAEFLQNQWQRNLGLNIQINQVEQKTFLAELRTSPPDIFRKGVGMDRPTCMNALETFAEDSRQNFIDLKDSQYNRWVQKMGQYDVGSQNYIKVCQTATNYLLDNHIVIPLGEMHFTIMASPKYEGWTLNGMNQLDLSQVHPSE